MATLQPSSASFSAIASPMPLLPPVMRATFPFSPRSMTASTEDVAVVTAVNTDCTAGDEVRPVRNHEGHEIGDFLDRAGPAERQRAREAGGCGGAIDIVLLHLPRDHAVQQVGLDVLRAHRV